MRQNSKYHFEGGGYCLGTNSKYVRKEVSRSFGCVVLLYFLKLGGGYVGSHYIIILLFWCFQINTRYILNHFNT